MRSDIEINAAASKEREGGDVISMPPGQSAIGQGRTCEGLDYGSCDIRLLRP